MATKVGNMFNIINLPRTNARVNAPYFEFSIDTIKRCKDHKKFPNLKPKDIYEIISPQCKAEIVNLYPNYDWKNIWIQLNFRYIDLHDRNVMFKYIYEILPTNKRLAQIRQRESPRCDVCNLEDSNVHKFLYCALVQECLIYLRKVIFYICGVNFESMLKVIMLDIPKIDKRNANSLCILVSSYIACVWFNRKNMNSILSFQYFDNNSIIDVSLRPGDGQSALQIFL